MNRRRVLLYVQHLLGVGHLMRSARFARACAERGIDTTLASGGAQVGGLDIGKVKFVQLPPLVSRDERFSGVVDLDGQVPSASWLDCRRDLLLDLFTRIQPHVLVIEMFPFGRRYFRFELLPLLDLARTASPRPWVVSSVRDILTERVPNRSAEAAEWAGKYFDSVLVHGDPKVIRFEESFPPTAEIADKLFYTGYIADRPGTRRGPGAPGWNEVIVSAGGGAVGEALLQTAIESRSLSRLASGCVWRLLAGSSLPEATVESLAAQAFNGTVVEPARPDFPDLLANCALSISQAGYNTVIAIVQARARAVIVPFSRGGQTEQRLRATRLEALGLARSVDERDLTPARLAAAVDDELRARRPPPNAVDVHGAERSTSMIAGWADRQDE